MTIRHRILSHIQKRFGNEPLPLRLTFWDGDVFDFSDAPVVTISVRSPRVVRHFLIGNMSRLSDAYVSGELAVSGSVKDVLSVGLSIADRIGRPGLANGLARLAAVLPGRHTRKRDAAAVRQHYDVSNEFYELWLDRRMIYSCGYFRTGAEDLELAQEQKLDHICRKLQLEAGDHVLDIGCGWGGLLCFAAQRYGVKATGITLSERQCDYARRIVHEAGLSDRVEIRLQDYRELTGAGPFDKIVSVGMYEHVGIRNLPSYFSIVESLLRPGGAVLNHGITAGDPEGRALGPAGGDFIDRYVFPGGELPHLSRAVYEVARSGLEIADVEDLRPHYARTLHHWVTRLEENAFLAEEKAGAERFRIWRMYMAGMGYAFDRGWLSIAQIVAYKPSARGPAERPWTREHQYGGVSVPSGPTWSDGAFPPKPDDNVREAARMSRSEGSHAGPADPETSPARHA